MIQNIFMIVNKFYTHYLYIIEIYLRLEIKIFNDISENFCPKINITKLIQYLYLISFIFNRKIDITFKKKLKFGSA